MLATVVIAVSVTALAGTSATMQTRSAADVYADKCAVCHGADGAGKTVKGKKLKVKDVRDTSAKMTAPQMVDIVMKGKDPDMEAFGKELGPEMSKQIVEYYRSLAKK
jgi:mono/diheme cytochrome c family protein